MCPSLHLFKPSRVPSQMLPSLAARTDQAKALDNPCFTEIVGTARSRKRSSPSTRGDPDIAFTIFEETLTRNRRRDRSDRANRSVRPRCTCRMPWSAVPIHRPPSRSRSNRSGCSTGPPPGSGYASTFSVNELPDSVAHGHQQRAVVAFSQRCVRRQASDRMFGGPGFHRQSPVTATAQTLPRLSSYREPTSRPNRRPSP